MNATITSSDRHIPLHDGIWILVHSNFVAIELITLLQREPLSRPSA